MPRRPPLRLLADDATEYLAGHAPARLPASATAEDRLVETITSASRAARGFVASVLADPQHFDGCGASVDTAELRDDFARDVFDHARTLYHAGRSVPLASLAARLKATKKYDSFHRLANDLADLYADGGVGANAEYYLSAVRKTGRQIDVYHAAQEAMRDVLGVDTDAAELDEIEGLAAAAIERRTAGWETGDDLTPIGRAVGEALAAVDRRHDPNAPQHPRTGWGSLDRVVNPFDPGDLVIIGARTSVGKTAFGVGVGLYAAMHGWPTLVFSLEMTRAAVGERVAVTASGAHGGRLRSGRGVEDDFRRLAETHQTLGGVPLVVNDYRTIRVPQMAGIARRMKRKHGLGLVIVDYLQIITPNDRRAPRWEQVAQVSRDLKILAGDLNVPVVALAQLNREVESRPDGRPRLADLREAGNIEQDADTVLMLYRHPHQDDQREVIRVGVIVAKQRNGSLGEVELEYVRPHLRFREPLEAMV